MTLLTPPFLSLAWGCSFNPRAKAGFVLQHSISRCIFIYLFCHTRRGSQQAYQSTSDMAGAVSSALAGSPPTMTISFYLLRAFCFIVCCPFFLSVKKTMAKASVINRCTGAKRGRRRQFHVEGEIGPEQLVSLQRTVLDNAKAGTWPTLGSSRAVAGRFQGETNK